MRPTPGTVISSLVHAGVLAWIVFGFSFTKLDAVPSEPLPVDLITPAQFDHLTKGAKTAKPARTAKLEARKVAPATPKAKPKLPEAKQDITPPPPTPAPPPPPPQEAETAPPPKPVEHKAVAKAAPPTPPALPVPAPRQLAEAELPKKPEPKKAEPKKPEPPKQEAEQKVEPKPAPKKHEHKRRVDRRQMARLDQLIAAADDTKTPDHPKKAAKAPPQKDVAQFDPDKIAALIDRRKPTRTASLAPKIEAESSAGVADGAEGQLSISEQTRIAEMVRQQVEACWTPPVGARGADDLAAVLQFSLNANGSLSGRPSVVNRSGAPYFQAAAESAQAAVYQCAPLRLPAKDYAYWKEVQIKFDPRDMAGG